MKQILLAVIAGATAFGVSAADGTFAASNIIGGVRYYIYDTDGTTKLAKANGAVQFLYNGAVVGTGTYGFLQDGTFSAGTISIPGQAGNTVSITVEVWDKTAALTYENAVQRGGGYLLAQTVTIKLGGDGNPPATAAALVGFRGGTLTSPEPSTIALAALGLGGLFWVSRRK